MKLHPGAKVAIDKLSMDELDIAEAMAAGQLASPQRYMNITLFAIRITGTGAAYRQALNEYVWRDPKLYLNDHFIKRCSGLAVIMSHPPENALDTAEFRDRVIGAIMFAYVKNGDEVWGIAKSHDEDATKVLEKYNLSTSPAVVFKPADGNRKLDLDDGSTLLIEGKPSLLDHIAICEEGVWDKGGGPTGVDSTQTNGDTDMADEKKADADAGEKLDKLLTAMDNLGSRMDAVEDKVTAKPDAEGCPPEMMGKLDDDAAMRKDDDNDEPAELSSMPEETAADKSRKDAARAHWTSRRDVYKKRRADAAKKDAELPEALKKNAEEKKEEAEVKDDELPADLKDKLDTAAKKDNAEEEGPKELKEMADGVRKDAARTFYRSRLDSYRQVRRDAIKPLSERLDDLAAKMPKLLSGEDADAFADAQARADSVYHALGKVAPRPLQGENLIDYRRRLAKGVQDKSDKWKGVHLGSLGAEAFGVVEGQVYADAMTAAKSPTDVPEDELREIASRDTTGRTITSFVGKPGAWMRDFSTGRRRVGRIRNSN